MEQTTVHKLLEVKGINKIFYGNKVLDDVSFNLEYGKVLGLVGQNGAGKSTLVKILTGVYKPDGGTIIIEGTQAKLSSVQDANEKGISIVFQEMSLAQNLTVAENIFVGNTPKKPSGLIDKKKLNEQAKELINKFNIKINPDDIVQDLSIGRRQIVEILKAISKKPKILILDEPTSALEDTEIKILFSFIEKLKKNNYSIIYISHYMSEIFEIVDNIMILRDGKHIKTCSKNDMNVEQLVSLMIGDHYKTFYNSLEKRDTSDETVLKLDKLTFEPAFRDISLEIKKGEIFGITGITGCGKAELCEVLYGIHTPNSGKVSIDNNKVNLDNSNKAKKYGVLFIPENRKTQGLFLDETVANNLIPCVLNKVSNKGFIIKEKILNLAEKYIKTFNIKLNSLDQDIRYLSGGNQQKVLISKCVADNPKILLAIEPTRGIDVASKGDIHKTLKELSKEGMSIIVVSSELDEILAICDRIAVLNSGELTALYERDEFSINDITISMHKSKEKGM